MTPSSRSLRPLASVLMLALFLGSPADQSALAQGSAGPLTADLYGDLLALDAAAGTPVQATLHGPGGVKGRASDVAAVDGGVVLRLRPEVPGTLVQIAPGDGLRVQLDGQMVISITVPTLRADLVPDERALLVEAAPGVEVELEGTGLAPGVPAGRYRLPSDGRLSIPIGAAGDERPHGYVTLRTAAGHAFRAGFSGLRAELVVGASTLSGRASAGSRVDVAITTPNREPLALDGIDVSAGMSWTAEVPWAEALVPGTVVDLAKASPVAGASHVLSAEVPALSVGVGDAGLVVRGAGPAGCRVQVRIGARVEARNALCDASGRFDVALPEYERVRPGERVTAALALTRELTVLAEATYYPFEVVIYGARVKGAIDEPGAAISITLRAADGRVKSQGVELASAASSDSQPPGYFSFDTTERIQPGDEILLDWRDGDPLVLQVPRLTAIADPVAETVSGEAPPGTRIEVGIVEVQDIVDVRAVDVDAAGRYWVDYRGLRDLGFGGGTAKAGNGVVDLIGGGGHVFRLGWAAVELSWRGGDGLAAVGPSGRDVSVVLVAPDGAERGRFEEVLTQQNRAEAFVPWKAVVLDSAGQVVDARAGDRYEVQVADERLTLTIPDVQAAVHVGANQVRGRAVPNADILVGILRLPGQGGTVRSDESGYFTKDFGTDAQLRYNDIVALSMPIGDRHKLWMPVRGPGMILDLDRASLVGSHEPRQDVSASVAREGRVVSRGESRTDRLGVFELVLAPLAGEPDALRTADRVELAAQGATTDRQIVMTAPALDVVIAPEVRALSGRAAADAELRVRVASAFARPVLEDGSGYVGPNGGRVPIEGDGTFRVAFPPTIPDGGPDFRPGQRFEAQLTLPSGHQALRRRYLPMANVQLHGPSVCGVGEPLDPVRAELRDRAGQVIAGAEGAIDRSGRFALLLRGSNGAIVASRPEQTVAITIGRRRIEVPLERIDLNVTWRVAVAGRAGAATQTTGSGPVRRDYYIEWPDGSCLGPVDGGDSLLVEGVTSTTGAMRRINLPPLDPGEAVTGAFYTEDGHRYYVRRDRTLGRIFVGTDRMTGRATPMTSVSADVSAADGRRGRGTATVGPDGTFTLRLRDDVGQPMAMHPGDAIVLSGETGDEPIIVEQLDLDASVEGGLVGVAPPSRTVDVTLTLLDGRVRAFTRDVDGTGRFEYRPEDLPEDRDWWFGDVVDVLVVLTTPDGHEMAVETHLQTPAGRDGKTAYIPFATLR